MPVFRKKPIAVEAVQWVDGIEPVDWLRDAIASGTMVLGDEPTGLPSAEIVMLAGVMRVSPGDWIIRGVSGELYPCKPDIFAKLYEPT